MNFTRLNSLPALAISPVQASVVEEPKAGAMTDMPHNLIGTDRLEFSKRAFVNVLNDPVLYQAFKEFCVADYSSENILFYSGYLELEQAIASTVPGYYRGALDEARSWVLHRFLRGVSDSSKIEQNHDVMTAADARSLRSSITGRSVRSKRRSHVRSMSPARKSRLFDEEESPALTRKNRDSFGEHSFSAKSASRRSLYGPDTSFLSRLELTQDILDQLTIRSFDAPPPLPPLPQPSRGKRIAATSSPKVGITPSVPVPPHLIGHFLYFFTCFLDVEPASGAEVNVPGRLKRQIAEHIGSTSPVSVDADGSTSLRRKRTPLLSTVFDLAVDHIVELTYFDTFRRFVDAYNKEQEAKAKAKQSDQQSIRSSATIQQFIMNAPKRAKDLVANTAALAPFRRSDVEKPVTSDTATGSRGRGILPNLDVRMQSLKDVTMSPVRSLLSASSWNAPLWDDNDLIMDDDYLFSTKERTQPDELSVKPIGQPASPSLRFRRNSNRTGNQENSIEPVYRPHIGIGRLREGSTPIPDLDSSDASRPGLAPISSPSRASVHRRGNSDGDDRILPFRSHKRNGSDASLATTTSHQGTEKTGGKGIHVWSKLKELASLDIVALGAGYDENLTQRKNSGEQTYTPPQSPKTVHSSSSLPSFGSPGTPVLPDTPITTDDGLIQEWCLAFSDDDVTRASPGEPGGVHYGQAWRQKDLPTSPRVFGSY